MLADLRNGYVDLCRHVLNEGERVSPRGEPTRELLGVTIEVEDLGDTLPVGVGRNLNLSIAALEALQLIGEVNRPELLVAASPRFQDFREGDGSFHGAYGLRVHGQVRRVLERLQSDSVSRQGIVTIWDPALDGHEVHADMPCTIALHLLPRDNLLHLQVYMRSNDVWLGLAYDYFVFSQWLHTVAKVLGLKPGRYTHHVSSLHLYERDVERVEQLIHFDKDAIVIAGAATQHPLGLDAMRHANLQAGWEMERLRAVQLLDDPQQVAVPGWNDRWYRELLLKVHKKLRQAQP